MAQLLASDDNNPAFAGATNPDARLAVKFYSKSVQNQFETDRQGRPIFFDRDYVQISVPGDPTSVIDTPVREDHKKRFPFHWQHYQNQHASDQREIGTPLAQWPRITPAQAEELRALKFYTVENIAGASDANLQRLGMLAGKSAYALRDDAKRFLELAAGDAVAQKAEARAKDLEEENRKLREDSEKRFAELQAQIAAMQAPKKRGGRPKGSKNKPKE